MSEESEEEESPRRRRHRRRCCCCYCCCFCCNNRLPNTTGEKVFTNTKQSQPQCGQYLHNVIYSSYPCCCCSNFQESKFEARNKLSSAFSLNNGDVIGKIKAQEHSIDGAHIWGRFCRTNHCNHCSRFVYQPVVCDHCNRSKTSSSFHLIQNNSNQRPTTQWRLQNKQVTMQKIKLNVKASNRQVEGERSQIFELKEEINVKETFREATKLRSTKDEFQKELNLSNNNSQENVYEQQQRTKMVKDGPEKLAKQAAVYALKNNGAKIGGEKWKGKRKATKTHLQYSHNLALHLFFLLVATSTIINHQDLQLEENISSKSNNNNKALHKDNKQTHYNGYSSDKQWPYRSNSKTISSRLKTYLKFPSFQGAQAALIQQQQAFGGLKTSGSKEREQKRSANKSLLIDHIGASLPLHLPPPSPSSSASASHLSQAEAKPTDQYLKAKPSSTVITAAAAAAVKPSNNKIILTSPKLLKTTGLSPSSLNWNQHQHQNGFSGGSSSSGNNRRNQNNFLVAKHQDDFENNAQNGEFPTLNNSSSSSSSNSDSSNEFSNQQQQQPQIYSITSRLSLIRVPVESNAILKCLISSQANKFTKRFKVHWSRFMYDENVYEQIESFSGPNLDQTAATATTTTTTITNEFNHSPNSEQQPLSSQVSSSSSSSSSLSHNSDGLVGSGGLQNKLNDEGGEEDKPLNRQQQLRDFLYRTRQEINVINELLIEATLSISPVKASDNASYYCTATDGLSDQKARIDLVALSKPIVQLDQIYPARDSKSAIIYWIIISDGNAPIKKTILMVKNDTTATATTTTQQLNNRMQSSESLSSSSSSSFIPMSFPKQQESLIEQQQQQQHQSNSHYSSVVIDSDYNQWQRIEISNDGEEISAEQMMMTMQTTPSRLPSSSSYSPYDLNRMVGDNNIVNAADVDVVSSSIGGQSQSSISSSSSGRSGDTQQDYIFNTGLNFNSPSDQSLNSKQSRWKQFNANSRFNHKRKRSFNLTSLLPGVTYNFKLAAINDLGQSNWTQLIATMPNEIPAQISEIFLLSKSNDSLTIGWRRPSYDNAKTIRYEMQLFDLNRTIEMNANTHTPPSIQGRNFMYIFVNLNPGTDYHFHIRACSKAGCSLFSTPKLLATTLDGEPDEPIDVELNCQYSDPTSTSNDNNNNNNNNNVTVSWLPPINIRGQLLNYSIQFDSYSRYKNLSGHWTIDEFKSTIETPDNHTLIFELGKVLLPNTNYTVRVCANNRSKHCGRLSTVSSQAQCSTPPELPNELPANIKLTTTTNISSNNDDSTVDTNDDDTGDTEETKTKFKNNNNNKSNKLESLLLELPFLPLRNGTIDCIQVVLIRLPRSFNGDVSQLDQFLPNEPRDIKLSHLIDLFEQEQNKTEQNNQQQQQVIDGEQKAVAYLAEEIEFINQISDKDSSTLANKSHKIILGDGIQNTCQRLRNLSVLNENLSYISSLDSTNSDIIKAFRVFDGSLRSQTFYTGFIKLILVRSPNHNNNKYEQPNQMQKFKNHNKQPDVLTKYSNYFNLVKTGDSVIEVQIPTTSEASTTSVHVASNQFGLDSPIQEMADKLRSNLKSAFNRLYNSSLKFFSTKMNFDSISDYIVHSTPTMQIFQVGMIVLALSLFILFALYLLLLPASIRRKRRRKMKKKLYKQQQQQQQHQLQQQEQEQQQQLLHHHQQQEQLKLEASNEQNYLISNDNNRQDDDEQAQSSYVPQAVNQIVDVQNHEHQNHSMSQKVIEYQHQTTQLDEQMGGHQLYSGSTMGRSHDCPIHSSPLAKHHNHQHQHQHQHHHHQQAQIDRGQISYQQLQSNQTQQVPYQKDLTAAATAYGTTATTTRNIAHQHHNHPHQHPVHYSHQLSNNYSNQELARQEQYERNCRTTRRVNAQNGIQLDFACNNNNNMINLPYQQANIKQQNAALTLNHQNSVLAFAKKINKSIPIRLFASVFECRLRNGWLREEYEQLPRQIISAPAIQSQSQSQIEQNKMIISNDNNLFLNLQPQIVVMSKSNSNISALISGNDQYDASLIELPLENDGNKKRIICARSPLDADSVWDFWRLVYEQNVNTIVMLTQNEDQNTGDIRCAQYWPTCDNEETTILSPCNEYVQKSNILPAKFKIRQETFENESRENDFKVRRLTLIVMATKSGENDVQSEGGGGGGETTTTTPPQSATNGREADNNNGEAEDDEDEEELTIVERNITHLQFYHWNTSNLHNQMRLIKFIEMANERHSKTLNKGGSPLILSPTDNNNGSKNQNKINNNNSDDSMNSFSSGPMLVHCFNGIGRSGLFAAMSFIIDDLAIKLNYEQQILHHLQHHHQQQQISQQDKPSAKLNIFQLVSRLRNQREMLLSPYRFYELLYQLTCNCIPTNINISNTTAIATTTTTTTTDMNTVTNTAQEHPAQIGARIMH